MRWPPLSLLLVLLLLTTEAIAENQKREFIHMNKPEHCSIRVPLQPGDVLDLTIHTVSGVTAETYALATEDESYPSDQASGVESECKRIFDKAGWTKAEPKEIRILIPHSAEYGGYIVMLKYPGAEGPVFVSGSQIKASECSQFTKSHPDLTQRQAREFLGRFGTAGTFTNVALVVTVDTQPEWITELSGGFSISGLTSPRYYLESVSSNGDDTSRTFTVRRNRRVEDDEVLGAVGFIHSRHRESKEFAISLGIGIGENSALSLFPGLSARMGGKAFITAGVNFGSVAALPKSLKIGSTTVDANALNQPDSRVSAAPFVAFSYSFLSPGEDAFKKPLAPIKKD